MRNMRDIAHLGHVELLATQALVHQVAAILVDASVRDTEEMRALGLPIWARWIRVRGATKTQIGAINEPVVVGRARIAAGISSSSMATGRALSRRSGRGRSWRQ